MFDALPDAARLWLFPLDCTVTDTEADALLTRLGGWLPTWASHGRPVRAEAEVLAGRALAVAALISEADLNAGVSGCGIDAMEHAVAEALDAHGLALADALSVTYRDEAGDWQSVPRPTFRRLTREGAADAATPILDVTPTTLGDLRAQGVERPAGETWAGRAFRLGAPA
ncbi:MAG: hypothetical protein AAF845_12485 [Bacteroidota bacterium]